MMNQEQITSLIQLHKRIALDHIKLADELHDQLATAPAAAPATGPGKPARDMTRREKEILKILQQEPHPVPLVAGRINLSSNAVHTYIARLKSHGITVRKETVATRSDNKGYYNLYWVDQKKEA